MDSFERFAKCFLDVWVWVCVLTLVFMGAELRNALNLRRA